jgi:hypothetical protein
MLKIVFDIFLSQNEKNKKELSSCDDARKKVLERCVSAAILLLNMFDALSLKIVSFV